MEESEIDKLCRLCRISATEEEKKKFLKSLDDILAYIKQLNELNTENVTPCLTVNEALRSSMRDDQPDIALSRDLFLANAPSHIGGMIRVPPVFKP